MQSAAAAIPPRYARSIDVIRTLEKEDRYLAAFLFGSVAEGTSTDKSDLDVRIIVNEDNPCRNINHPVIDGYKLDVTFRSVRQEREKNEEMIRTAFRVPNLRYALILFDKTGDLEDLKQRAQEAQPDTFTAGDHQLAHFLIYHADGKVQRFLQDDPAAALFSMHFNLQDVLRVHYQLAGRWWLSDKALLRDLRIWDPNLASSVEQFVAAADVDRKYRLWMRIVDHVLIPLGGRQPIAENNCRCDACARDLAPFFAAAEASQARE